MSVQCRVIYHGFSEQIIKFSSIVRHISHTIRINDPNVPWHSWFIIVIGKTPSTILKLWDGLQLRATSSMCFIKWNLEMFAYYDCSGFLSSLSSIVGFDRNLLVRTRQCGNSMCYYEQEKCRKAKNNVCAPQNPTLEALVLSGLKSHRQKNPHKHWCCTVYL